MNHSKGTAMKKGGMAKKGYAKGGAITASGPDTAGSQGKTLSQNVTKSVQGDTVSVRGLGASRARTAKIY